MARRCALTGKGAQTGHKVSHSNRKAKRRFLPNLNVVSLVSEALGGTVRLRLSAAGLRSVEHRGGIDAYLAAARADELPLEARRLKKRIADAAKATA